MKTWDFLKWFKLFFLFQLHFSLSFPLLFAIPNLFFPFPFLLLTKSCFQLLASLWHIYTFHFLRKRYSQTKQNPMPQPKGQLKGRKLKVKNTNHILLPFVLAWRPGKQFQLPNKTEKPNFLLHFIIFIALKCTWGRLLHKTLWLRVRRPLRIGPYG